MRERTEAPASVINRARDQTSYIPVPYTVAIKASPVSHPTSPRVDIGLGSLTGPRLEQKEDPELA